MLNLDAIANGGVAFSDGISSINASLWGNGNNFYSLTGSTFSFIDVTLPGDNLANTKSIRIGGVQGATTFAARTVPEPSGIALALLSLGALAAVCRRRVTA